jgi:hypothetical protein
VPGSGNHLEPYLAKGEGVRILVLAAAQAQDARAALLPRWPAVPEVREASRTVAVDGTAHRATFHWFPLPFDVVPGVLSAVVEHRSRELVLHPSFSAHPNGLRAMAAVVAQGRADGLADPGLPGAERDAPRLVLNPSERPLAITHLALSGEGGENCLLRVG